MKCARCDRELKKPAITFGKYGMGRVCAEKAGLLKPRKRKRNAMRDSETIDWIEQQNERN